MYPDGKPVARLLSSRLYQVDLHFRVPRVSSIIASSKRQGKTLLKLKNYYGQQNFAEMKNPLSTKSLSTKMFSLESNYEKYKYKCACNLMMKIDHTSVL